jgi:hypothetical protein
MVSGHDAPVSVENLVPPSTALEIAAATVGKPTQLRWRAPDGGAASTLLSISITHLEKHKMVFAIDNVPVDKDYLLDFQFPDGAEYRVNSMAQLPGRGPLRTEQLVAVSGVEPPMAAQVPALALFLAVIALGLGPDASARFWRLGNVNSAQIKKGSRRTTAALFHQF